MIDLDELDRMLDAGDRFGHATSPAVVRELIAELRTLRAQRHELAGVVADVEVGRGFDDICLKTIKRVIGVLGGAAHPKEGV